MNLLVVLGPTASGKTQLAVQAAQYLGGEIVSADSRQVYRGLDIGSGKDLQEYAGVPYHLIDVVEPGVEFSLFDFIKGFSAAYEEIVSRNRLPIIAGGTGLYLDAVLRRYELVDVPESPELRKELAVLSQEELVARLRDLRPVQHNSTDILDRERLIRAIEVAEGERQAGAMSLALPEIDPLVVGLRWSRKELRQRITRRLQQRLKHGMIEEVEALHAAGVSWETLEYYGLEYRFVAHYLQGHLSRNDLFQKLNSAIHQFAKRQETWFRRMERHGIVIHWLDAMDSPADKLLALVKDNNP